MKNKHGSMRMIFIVMLVSLGIASLWDKLPAIKNSIHYLLDPTAGALMNWQLTIGMLIVVLIITTITTIIQKYTTDQTALKELKKEQKAVQKEMKEHKSNPQKMKELQKKQMSFIPKQFKLSMGSMAYTAVPLILLFRWFGDYFADIITTTGEPVRFFGMFGWFLFYLIATIVFSSILKKWWDIA